LLVFKDEKLLEEHPTSQLQAKPLSAAHDPSFSALPSNVEAAFFIHKSRTRHAVVTKDPTQHALLSPMTTQFVRANVDVTRVSLSVH
jgi:hypothetical protein